MEPVLTKRAGFHARKQALCFSFLLTSCMIKTDSFR